jgi:hypothetical protein
MKKLIKFAIVPSLVLLLTILQVYAEETVPMEQEIGEGSILIYFVDDSNEVIETPDPISFAAVETSFEPMNGVGILGTSTQKLRAENSSNNDIEVVIAPEIITNFGTDGYWVDGENSYPIHSENSADGKMTIDPSAATILDDGGCDQALSINPGSEESFLFIDDSNPETNVESIKLFDTSNGNYCYFDLTNLPINQVIPALQAPGSYQFTMVLTITTKAI